MWNRFHVRTELEGESDRRLANREVPRVNASPAARHHPAVGRVEDDLLRRYVVRRRSRRPRGAGRADAADHPPCSRVATATPGTSRTSSRRPRWGLDEGARALRPRSSAPTSSATPCPTMIGEMRRWLRDHTWAVRPPREERAETLLELISAYRAPQCDVSAMPRRRPRSRRSTLTLARRPHFTAAMEALPRALGAVARRAGPHRRGGPHGRRPARHGGRGPATCLRSRLAGDELGHDARAARARRHCACTSRGGHVPARDRPAHGHVADEGLPCAAPRGRAAARGRSGRRRRGAVRPPARSEGRRAAATSRRRRGLSLRRGRPAG